MVGILQGIANDPRYAGVYGGPAYESGTRGEGHFRFERRAVDMLYLLDTDIVSYALKARSQAV